MNKKILLGQRLFTGRKKKPLENNYTISLINFFVKDVFWMYFGLLPFAFQKKGVKYFEVSAMHGDSAALREITRRWSFPETRRGHRPSAFLCGIPFGFADESGDPGRCFRKSHRHPRA